MNIQIPETNIELSAYVNAGGNLVLRVNLNGICVADVGIHNITSSYSPDQLMHIGALTVPVLRDLQKPELNDMFLKE